MNNEELTTRLTECRQAKHILQDIIDGATAEVKELNRCRDNQRVSITGFIARNDELVDRVEELKSHEGMVVGNLRGINVRLHKTIDERDERIEEIGNKNTELEAEVERLRMKIFDIEGREDLGTTELVHRVEELDTRLDNCHQVINTVTTQKDELIKSFVYQNKRRDEYIKQKENHVKTLEAKIIQQSSHLRDSFDCIDKQCSCIDELDEHASELVGRNIRLMHKVEGLEDEKRGLIKAIAMGQGSDLPRLEECRQAKRSLQGIIDALTNDKKSLQWDISMQDKHVEEIEAAICELNSRADELEAEREQSEQYVARAEAYESRLRSYIASYEYKIESDETNLELLDILLRMIDPLLLNGGVPLSNEMKRLCNEVIDFRRKHSIVG